MQKSLVHRPVWRQYENASQNHGSIQKKIKAYMVNSKENYNFTKISIRTKFKLSHKRIIPVMGSTQEHLTKASNSLTAWSTA